MYWNTMINNGQLFMGLEQVVHHTIFSVNIKIHIQ